MARRAILAALLGALAFASTLRGGFVQDDHVAVENNAALRQGLGAVLTHDYWGGSAAGTWRPVAQVSLWLDARISGMRPWVFHLDNVLLHALVCALFVPAFGTWQGAMLAAVLAPGAEAVQAVI